MERAGEAAAEVEGSGEVKGWTMANPTEAERVVPATLAYESTVNVAPLDAWSRGFLRVGGVCLILLGISRIGWLWWVLLRGTPWSAWLDNFQSLAIWALPEPTTEIGVGVAVCYSLFGRSGRGHLRSVVILATVLLAVIFCNQALYTFHARAPLAYVAWNLDRIMSGPLRAIAVLAAIVLASTRFRRNGWRLITRMGLGLMVLTTLSVAASVNAGLDPRHSTDVPAWWGTNRLSLNDYFRLYPATGIRLVLAAGATAAWARLCRRRSTSNAAQLAILLTVALALIESYAAARDYLPEVNPSTLLDSLGHWMSPLVLTLLPAIVLLHGVLRSGLYADAIDRAEELPSDSH
ncbi:MAG: hypothetical protein QM770_00990 [Tepidisphaeraceae bacterium]